MNDHSYELTLFFVCVTLLYFFAGLVTTWVMMDYLREFPAVFLGIVWPLTAIIIGSVVCSYSATRWFINLRIWDSHTDHDGKNMSYTYYYLFTVDGRLFYRCIAHDPSVFQDMVVMADRYGVTLTWSDAPIDQTGWEHSGE